MKKALRKDFWMEIRKNMARFLSIFCIVALGVAFFSGIQASSPDMRFSGDAYFDDRDLMDVRVMGTLGLTDADVAAVKEVEGVLDAEGAYGTDVLCELGDAQEVLHIESLNEQVNQIEAVEGRLPEKSGECFLDRSFAESCGYEVGDEVRVSQDGDSELLKRETFTVAGIGISPLYISFDRGNTTLGTGEVGGFAYVMPEDFDQDVFTQVYVRVRGAKDMVSYSDAYEDLVEKITDRLEGIEGIQCQMRYDEVVADANEELEDAEEELEEGRRTADSELSDAREELEDAKEELEDGKRELEDGKKDLEDAKEELIDGKRELEDGKRDLEDGKAQLADAKEQVEGSRAELDSAQGLLASGWAAYEENKKKLEEGEASLAEGKRELEEGEAQIEEAKGELDEKQSELDASRAELEDGKKELGEARAALEGQRAELEQNLSDVAALEQQLPQIQAGVEAARDGASQLKAAVDAAQGAVNEAQAAADEAQAAYDAARGAEDAAQAAYDAASLEADEAQAAYDAAQAAYDAGEGSLEELDAARQHRDDAAAARDAAAGELDAARQGAAAASQALGAATSALDAARQGYDEAAGRYAEALSKQQELEGQLAAAQEAVAQKGQIEDGLSQIDGALLELDGKEKELEEAEGEIAAGQEAIDEARAEVAAQEEALAPYKEEIAENEKVLAEGRKELEAGGGQLSYSQRQVEDGIAQLLYAEGEIAENEKKLSDGEEEIAENEKKIADGEREIADGEREIAENEGKIADGERDLADGWEEYDEAKADAEEEIADGEREIADAREEIADIEQPEWIVSDRNDLPEYADYGDNADRIRNIGRVFPVIFFLVAALISLTTMTRMVEEQRTQIGTLKALGYGKLAIASKYICYALLATVGGSIVGVLIGEKILPFIIIKAYGIMYHSMSSILVIDYEWKYSLIAAAAAIACTLGATVFACYKELSDTPASLMRPPAPREGKRVLVERIPIFWNHLNFTWKSTLRNLFRYKKRLFMTIFGISGSMALMLVGYGIKDSVGDIVVRQYSLIQHYDGMIIDNEDATDGEREEMAGFLEGNEKISRFTKIHFDTMDVPRGKTSIQAYVYVPESLDTFSEDVTLQDRRSGERYELTDEGAVISEKTASLTGLSVGDDLPIERDRERYSVRIAAITENYMGHYIYLTQKVYEETFGEEPDYRDIVFTMAPDAKDEAEEVGKEILSYPAALSITYTKSIADQVGRMISTLSLVIVVLIVSAGMLAFVVLYNLNNINITERQRELATLKVLGFYDSEVSAYVLRENVLLTLLSILIGSGFGVLLHRFVIVTVEVDTVMFARGIHPVSFLYCALFTAGFSVVVNVAMHFKLKRIDMVESLKSVE